MKPLPRFVQVLFIIACLCAIPHAAHAGVYISEIMYDPAGTDDKHEWVEVHNDGASVDIGAWKLFEGGTNHGLTVVSVSALIPTGGYAIIASDPATFRLDYPTFSGTILDVSLSGGLNNTSGETRALRTDAPVDMDSVTYAPSIGAAGDGNSLHKSSGSWVAAAPTPGAALNTSGSNTTQTTVGSTASSTTPAVVAPVQRFAVEPQMYVSIGEDRTVGVGSSVIFTARTSGLKGEPVGNVRVLWNFGDGAQGVGSPIQHVYTYPGVYAVVADATNDVYAATDRMHVTVVEPQLRVGTVTADYIDIENRGTTEIDVGGWVVRAGTTTFAFPRNTIALPQRALRLPSSVTKLRVESFSEVSLFYPDGRIVGSVVPKVAVESVPLAAAVRATPASVPSKVVSVQKAAPHVIDLTNIETIPVQVESSLWEQSKNFFSRMYASIFATL